MEVGLQVAESQPILLVEDDDALRAEVRELLEQDGNQVVEAADGWEALHYLRRQGGCGAIVLDMKLPVMSGWELLSRLRGDDRLRDVPVIILSGRAVADAVGTPPVFRKPLGDPARFLEVVRQCRRTRAPSAG